MKNDVNNQIFVWINHVLAWKGQNSEVWGDLLVLVWRETRVLSPYLKEYCWSIFEVLWYIYVFKTCFKDISEWFEDNIICITTNKDALNLFWTFLGCNFELPVLFCLRFAVAFLSILGWNSIFWCIVRTPILKAWILCKKVRIIHTKIR